jgi:hypothetical protein
MKLTAYALIASAVEVPLDGAAARTIDDDYARPHKRYAAGGLVAGLVCLGLLVAANVAGPLDWAIYGVYAALLAAFVLAILAGRLRQGYPQRLAAILEQEADPVTYLELYSAFLAHTRSTDLVGAASNYARALRFAGRHEEALALAEALKEACGVKRPEVACVYETIRATCAFDTGNHELLQEAVAAIEAQDLRRVPVALATNATMATVLAGWWDKLRNQQDAAYEQAVTYFEAVEPLQKGLFALMATCAAPNQDTQRTWVARAIKLGGSTWPRAVAQDMKAHKRAIGAYWA